ncbi:hypothetical protein [Rugamonas sp.]|uniref:hypothetical protein n=1 Tax=Rugamonas sp. TaxID=1926287 RepID=UPI0025F6033D|nr:hypothetical protein [Rugamonas sp.]
MLSHHHIGVAQIGIAALQPDEKEAVMERAGEAWSYPQARATSNAALAARVADLEAENAALRLTGAVVYPPDGTVSPFTIIHLGHGQVRLGDCVHDKRLPGLWIGRDGLGMGVTQVLNRCAKPDETLAVISFANVEGLDVLLDAVQRIRKIAFLAAPVQPAAQQDINAALDRADVEDAARFPDQKRDGEWREAQRVCDLPAVHEMIQGFADDQTGDNATMVVREVMRAIAQRAGSGSENSVKTYQFMTDVIHGKCVACQLADRVATLELGDLDKLRHAVGAVQHRPKRTWGLRNYFCAGRGGAVELAMRRLVAAGFMSAGHESDKQSYFHATKDGCKMAGLDAPGVRRAMEDES